MWSLFAGSNETTALKNVIYEGKSYQIKNNFFPYRIIDLKHWEIKDPDFKLQLSTDTDRYVATWLLKNKLSNEATSVLEKGKEVYKLFYSNLNNLATHKFKIETWDAGWYQIRRCLTESNIGMDELNDLKALQQKLAEKIFPKIEEYGFLDKDEVYEEL